jgi:hypothetical protein
MNAHFFDLDAILNVDNKVWIIDIKKPKFPIYKIDQSDYNLIKSNIWKNKGERFNFNGDNYWLPDSISNDLKIKCKNLKVDTNNLTFSMQEFFNSEVIGDLEYSINLDILNHVKNTTDHLYLICSKNNKKNYELIIKKIESKFLEMGLKFEDIYYLSETFFNRKDDKIIFNKIKILLQFLVGLKTEDNKFVDIEISKYDVIDYYDDDISNVNINPNDFLKYLYDNTDSVLKDKIDGVIKSNNNILNINYVSPNKVNRIQKKKIILELNKIIKTFESFKRNNL